MTFSCSFKVRRGFTLHKLKIAFVNTGKKWEKIRKIRLSYFTDWDTMVTPESILVLKIIMIKNKGWGKAIHREKPIDIYI